MAIGFALRVNDLGVESFGEDELNKLQTVEEYRTNGLSGKNGEHPFLMKGLQTASVVAAESLNKVVSPQYFTISDEAALRFPVALFGTFTSLLIFLLISELFGRSIGLVSAVLWAVEPMAIGFDRIAKEDSLVLFFFLLTNLFWIRSQTAAERGSDRWTWFAWAAAASFAALMASKYYPFLLGITAAYYNIFKFVPGNKWNLEGARWLKFFVIMGLAFLILNPTIVLPDTWREMLKFSSENRIGHDSYEFMGELFPNKMTAWLAGVPWIFYYIFIAVKTSLPTLFLFIIGLPLMFRRNLGDGRFFIFFWAFIWFMPFTVLGGKFTRYFTFVEPLLLITAAVAFCFVLNWVSAKFFQQSLLKPILQSLSFAALVAAPLLNSLSVAPHFRMFTNEIGGMSAAGTYFPHDEFYDAGSRDIVAEISARAGHGAAIACETPMLFEYYARKVGRDDLTFLSLSDKSKVKDLKVGDFVVITRGRRYFSNSAYENYLGKSATANVVIKIGKVDAAWIYQLDQYTAADIQAMAKSDINRN